MSRKRIAGIVLIVLVIAAVVAVAVVPTGGGRGRTGDAVAVVHLAGPIQDSVGSPLGGAAITPMLVRERLEAAEHHAGVQAVVLRLDTPGGTAAASQEVAALIAEFPLPVVVSMGDVAASGGYYAAAGADRIVAKPATMTGSIGVIMTILDVQGLLDKLGVEVEAVTAGQHKDMLLPGRMTPERRAILQTMADQLYDQFVTAVADGRGLSQQQVRQLATGQPYTGQQALDLGLVDVLGGLDEAVNEAEDLAGIEDAHVIELRPSLFEQLFGGPQFGAVQKLLRRGVEGDEIGALRSLLDTVMAPRYGAA
ncbi:MAG: signal peptide peptidase SppA [Actinomycetota bacterium]|nr:signal peptide peptidase SppA [Actinomycetota bacterium]